MKDKLTNKKDPYTESIKVRVNPLQKKILKQTAKSRGIKVSALIREAIYPSEAPSSATELITRNLIKNEILNRMTALNLPNTYKQKIIEELIDID